MTSSQQDAVPEATDEAAVKPTAEDTDNAVEEPNHKPKKPVPVKDPWDMGGSPSQTAG